MKRYSVIVLNKYVVVAITLMLSLLLTACGGVAKDNGKNLEDVSSYPLQVAFTTQPTEGITVGSEVIISVEVTQGGQEVEDAGEVKFEIWHESEAEQPSTSNHGSSETKQSTHHGQVKNMQNYHSKHEMIEAEHQGNGMYSIRYSFEKEGTYYVMYHVTARDMHSMTTHEVEVANH